MAKSQKKSKLDKGKDIDNDFRETSLPKGSTSASDKTSNDEDATKTENSAISGHEATDMSEACTLMVQSQSTKNKSGRRKRKYFTIKEASSQKSNERDIFNGLTLAISTLESTKSNDAVTNTPDATTEDTADEYHNFKTLSNILKTRGAIISPQVHKRVHFLVSTEHAVNNLTQRVRQALKRHVDIIDVCWVKDCVERGKRVDVEKYLLNEMAGELMSEKEKEKADTKTNIANATMKTGYESDIPDENNAGWSSPVQLDCCCVCHENGDDNCPWCTECNINLAKSK